MNKNNNQNTMMNGILWTFTGTGVQTALQFIVFIVLSRLLSPENFGVMSTALAIITVFTIISKLGIGPSIVQKETLENRHIYTGFSVSIVFSLLLSLLIWNTANMFSGFFNMYELESILKTLAVLQLIQGLSIVPEALLQRELKFKKIALVQMYSYLAYGVFGIILSYLDYGVWALVCAYIANVFVKTIMYLYFQSFRLKLVFEIAAAKDLLVFGVGYSLSSFYNQIALQGDTFVIGKFLGANSLGVYSRAYQLFAMPVNLIGNVIEKVLFPSFSKLQSDSDKLQEVYKNSITLTALLCIPISLYLILFGDEIILILFGEKWSSAIIPFKVLVIGLMPRVSYKISDALIKSQGKVYKSANRQLIYGITIILGVYIGQQYGLFGASLGVLSAIIINYIYMSQIGLSISNLKWIDLFKSYIPTINFCVICFTPVIVIRYFSNTLNLNPYLILILTSTILLGIGALLIFKNSFFIFRENYKIIEKIKKEFKVKLRVKE